MLSGTFANSSKAAEKIQLESGKKITVLDSLQTSAAGGLVALRIAEAIEKGFSHDEIVVESAQWIKNSKLFVGAHSLTSFIKGGRVSPAKGFIGKLLNTKPIVTITAEGKAVLFDKAFSYKGSLRKTMKHTSKYIGDKKFWGYSILHARNEDTALWYASEIEAVTVDIPAYADPLIKPKTFSFSYCHSGGY